LAHAPGQVARSDFAVAVGAKADALPAELATQTVVVREAAVVHEAQVEPSRERMRVVGRHSALGRHPRMPEGVRAAHLVESETADKRLRAPGFLVDLDRLA